MAEVKLSAEQFTALLAGVDKSKLTTEQVQSLETAKAEVDKAEKAAALKEKLTALDTQLLTNVSLYKDMLNSITDIPGEINTIKLPFELIATENAETKELSYSFTRSAAFPIEDTNFPYVSTLLNSFIKELDGQSKPFAKTTVDLLNTLSDDETFVDRVKSKQSYESNAGLNIRNRFTSESAIPFMNDIDIAILTESEVKTGSIVVTYNSAELVKSSTDGKETDAVWSITTCKFGKTTKYKSSNGGNGRKSKAADWIPDTSEAASLRAYLIEQHSDEAGLKKAVDKHTADGETDWSKINASQHLLRIEAELDVSKRPYTDHKATQ